MGHSNIDETAEIEFLNSSKILSELTAYDIIEDNLKKLKTELKKSIEENYKNIIQILTTYERQRKTSCGYINSNWSFRLVDSASSYRIWIELSKQPCWDLIRLRCVWENMQSTNILSLR